MMIMVVSFSKIFFFLSSLKLNQSARLMQRLEHRPFVVRCEASSNGREEARYEAVLV
uniref:DRBM domain-containing protein n=1 Tax=Brassica oleracea var. oleracea TaxID=109376 RepID=A0A0D3BGV1_BRAOL